MENQETARRARSLTDMLRRRRDPSGDIPFDPDGEPPMEDGEARPDAGPIISERM